MDKSCLVPRVVTSTSARVAGLCGLSSLPAWTSVVWATSVKLSKVDMCHTLISSEDNFCRRAELG